MKKKVKNYKSVKMKLFLSLSIVIIAIITCLIILNNVIFETFYLHTKQETLKTVYKQINEYYNSNESTEIIESELEKIAIKNNFDILIKSSDNTSIYTSNKDFFYKLGQVNQIIQQYTLSNSGALEGEDKFTIEKTQDVTNGMNYVLLVGSLDNGYLLFIRLPITSIEESVKISNEFLYLIAGFIIVIGGIIVLFVSKRFSDPILELNDIAKKMSNLDFSQKYKVTNAQDEIDELGKSINTMSNKLEATIKQLRTTNIELEKDIEQKSKIDDMRKSFISDVSHELKTPIALIQGYSEGLLENVNVDDENRKFYASVILDEAVKMDKLVKQLLELMKLEYEKREFNNKKFNIVELEKEVVRKSKVMLDENQIEVQFDENEFINVYADDFYIEQVITNYMTNAIKNAKEKDNIKMIKINNSIDKNRNVVRVSVFNTGDIIKEEDQARIWNRFYKVDESRNRADGGTGIGLSLVKAIMNNYEKKYGVVNKDNGVEFYFELDLSE